MDTGAGTGEQVPLITAAKNGQVEEVDRLLKEGNVDVNIRSKEGKTALMAAALDGQSEVLDRLLEAGNVDVNARDKHGGTALIAAAATGRAAIVERLLDAGADIRIIRNNNWTAMDEAEGRGFDDVELLLRRAGATSVWDKAPAAVAAAVAARHEKPASDVDVGQLPAEESAGPGMG